MSSATAGIQQGERPALADEQAPLEGRAPTPTVAAMIEVVARIPTVEEYSTLRASVGWKVAGAEDCATALDATVAGAVVEVEGETIAMGRTVGDEVFYTFVVDLVVRPDHQRLGLGSQLLVALTRATALRSATGLLQLVADEGLGRFYERNGFRRGDDGLYSMRLSAADSTSAG